jgi:DNA-binding MarR family transcriptional regulator
LQDEREVEISLTPEGQALRTRALAVRRDIVSLLNMSDSQIGALRNELNSLIATLNVES